MGEHLPCKQGVMGSNPIISIKRAERFEKDGPLGPCDKTKGFERNERRVKCSYGLIAQLVRARA